MFSGLFGGGNEGNCNSGCNSGGIFGGCNCTWIILIILFLCFCGCGGGCKKFNFSINPCCLILVFALLFCCGGISFRKEC